jgi:hypothetical protein
MNHIPPLNPLPCQFHLTKWDYRWRGKTMTLFRLFYKYGTSPKFIFSNILWQI